MSSGLFNHQAYSIEHIELEGPSKIIWFQACCYKQGHLPLDQVAQSPIHHEGQDGRRSLEVCHELTV